MSDLWPKKFYKTTSWPNIQIFGKKVKIFLKCEINIKIKPEKTVPKYMYLDGFSKLFKIFAERYCNLETLGIWIQICVLDFRDVSELWDPPNLRWHMQHPGHLNLTHCFKKAWGALECQEGVSGLSKNSHKKVFFHNWALYVHMVSNSCKIGLKGYNFLEIWRI